MATKRERSELPRDLRRRRGKSIAGRFGLRGLSAVAVLVAGIAVYAAWRSGLVVTMFGPPRVVLAEAYDSGSGSAAFDHSAFDHLLRTYVDRAGWVDYRGLAGHVRELDAYIESLASAPFEALRRDEKLALLINAYNAFTLRLILDYWDGGALKSIRDIPEDKRWLDKRWNVGGAIVSLDAIENQRIRPRFKEPRIHFSLVCAAVGCPPLRNEAFVGDRLEAQLESQTRYIHAQATWCRVDPGSKTVYLTALYNWYGSDFEQVAGSVLNFAAKYSEPLRKLVESGVTPQQEWLDYDWALNDVRNRRPR